MEVLHDFEYKIEQLRDNHAHFAVLVPAIGRDQEIVTPILRNFNLFFASKFQIKFIHVFVSCTSCIPGLLQCISHGLFVFKKRTSKCIERVTYVQSCVESMQYIYYIYYSAHSPLGLFSGRLHQVLCLLFNLN